MLKLPRQLETDPRRASIEAELARELKPLWERGTLPVAHVRLTAALEKALQLAFVSRQLERGLEQIEKLLANEEHGLAAARARQGTAPAHRASRLLVMADGGSERFYRNCETILVRHADRVLGLRLAVDGEELGLRLLGPDEAVKALLVSGREAVTGVLASLSGQQDA